ncbi:MAG: lipid-A-disaccharide synthase [Tatlockia sp.]|nr:lipid-A-disaccharide synthase [Tatlockia sp.]
MHKHKRIVVVAGEESGDFHAASFVRQLKAENKNFEFSGIGGRHMQNAGVLLISDLASYGVTGLTAVVRHLSVLRKAFYAIKAHLEQTKPDLLILVDYPGFNLRLAKVAKKMGIRTLYYISPQIWAWKAKRINLIRSCIDRMAVILPFEKTIYENAKVPVSFVGHPLVEKINHYDNTASARKILNLPLDKQLVAMLPGSRINEIEKHLPILVAVAEKLHKQLANMHFVIPIAGTLDPLLIQNYFANSKVNISFILGKATEVVACSDCAVVASGTASLECALLEVPMCIIYKSSLLNFILAMKLIKVKYLGLCNLLQNEMVVPELLQYDCNPIELTRALVALLTDDEHSTRMRKRLKNIKYLLSAEQADCSIAELIQAELLHTN